MISPATTTGSNSKPSASSPVMQGSHDYKESAVKMSEDDLERTRSSFSPGDKLRTEVRRTLSTFRTLDLDLDSKKNATSALKIQSFVRGCLCRARVSDMVARLIERLVLEQNATAMDVDGVEDIREEGYNDSTHHGQTVNTDGDDDEETIDGLHFPSSLPSDFLKEGNDSAASWGLNDSFEGNLGGGDAKSTTTVPTTERKCVPTWGGLAKEALDRAVAPNESESHGPDDSLASVKASSVRDRTAIFGQGASDGKRPFRRKSSTTEKRSSLATGNNIPILSIGGRDAKVAHSAPFKSSNEEDTGRDTRSSRTRKGRGHEPTSNVSMDDSTSMVNDRIKAFQNPGRESTKDHDKGGHSARSNGDDVVLPRRTDHSSLSGATRDVASEAPRKIFLESQALENEKKSFVRDVVSKSEKNLKQKASSYRGADTSSRSGISDIDSRNGSQHSLDSSAGKATGIASQSPSEGRKSSSSSIRYKMSAFGDSVMPAETKPMSETKSKSSGVPHSLKKKGYWITPSEEPSEEPKVVEPTEKALDIPPVFGVVEAKGKKKGTNKSSTKTKTKAKGAYDNKMEIPVLPVGSFPVSSAVSEMEAEGTSYASIAARKIQLGIGNLPSAVNGSTQMTETALQDEDIKRLDLAARRYMMESMSTRIQALVRGRLCRMKDRDAMLAVVKWLKQHRRIDLNAEATAASSEDSRQIAVEALAAEIEQMEPRGETSRTQWWEFVEEQPILSLEAGKKFFQEMSERRIDVEVTDEHLSGSQNFSTRLKMTRARQSESATKIQSLFRGTKVRSVDYLGMQQALRLLKEYKLALSREQDGDFDLELSTINDLTSEKARATLAAVRAKFDRAAIKIQTICRGFIARKFDLNGLVRVLSWIQEQKDAFAPVISSYEPDEAALTTAWTFLVENNTWTRDPSRSLAAANASSEGLDRARHNQSEADCSNVDVTDLLNTWEWLLENEKRQTGLGRHPSAPSKDRLPSEKNPEIQNLATLEGWAQENHVNVGTNRSRILFQGNELPDLCSRGRTEWNSCDVNTVSTCVSTVLGSTKNIKIAKPAPCSDSATASNFHQGKNKEIAEKRFYRNDSISARGHNEVAQEDPRIYQDNSISTGGKGDQQGNIVAKPVEVKRIDEMLSLWKWLESNQMDMKVFHGRRQGHGDNKSVGLRRSICSRQLETYGTHSTHDEIQARGDGVEYLDEDLSAAFSTEKILQVNKNSKHGKINGPEKVLKDVDDNPSSTDDIKSAIDIQIAYKDDSEASNSALKTDKPSMESMLKYWSFSSQYSPALVGVEYQQVNSEELNGRAPHKANQSNNTNRALSEISEQDPVAAWRQSPAKNELLGTLAWLKHHGIKLEEVRKPETKSDGTILQDRDDSSAEWSAESTAKPIDKKELRNSIESTLPTKSDIADTLQWLQTNGFPPASRIVETESIDNSPVNLNCQSENFEKERFEEIGTDAVKKATIGQNPPSASEIVSALKWLEWRGEQTAHEHENDQETINDISGQKLPRLSLPSPTSEVGCDPGKMDIEFDNVLFSLSWLKKHGFSLGKDSLAPRSSDGEMSDFGRPTLQDVSMALESIEGSSSDTLQSKVTHEGSTSVNDEMKRTLAWLSKRGMKLPNTTRVGTRANESSSLASKQPVDTEKPPTDSRFEATETEPTSAGQIEKIVSAGEPKPARRTSESNAAQEISAAMQWFQSRGIKLEKKSSLSKSTKSAKLSDVPSVKEAEAAIDSLNDTPEEYGRSASEQVGCTVRGIPSAKEVEKALSWLKLRESTKKPATKPSTMMEAMQKTRRMSRDRIATMKEHPNYTGKPVPDKDPSLKEPVKDTIRQTDPETCDRIQSRSSDKPRKEGGAAPKPTKNEMEKALLFLQHHVVDGNVRKNSASKSGREGKAKPNSTPLSKQGAARPASQRPAEPIAKEAMTQEERDYNNALRWLSNEAIDAPEDIPFFTKLDSMLPRKASQTTESRAKEIAKALKWVKRQGIVLSGKRQVAKPSTDMREEVAATGGLTAIDNESGNAAWDLKSPQIPRGKDYQNCMKWLTSKDRASVEDANYFRKLDTMLPNVPSQTNDERARDMVRALRWVKKKSARKESVPSTTYTATTTNPIQSTTMPTTRKGSKSKPSASPGEGTSRWNQARESLPQMMMEKQKKSKEKAPVRVQEARGSLPQMMKRQKELREAAAASRSADATMQGASPKPIPLKVPPRKVEPTSSKAKVATSSGNSLSKPVGKKQKPKKDEKGKPNFAKKQSLTSIESPSDKKKQEPNAAASSDDPSAGSVNEAIVQNALRWLHNEDRDGLEDASTFKKLDSMLPRRAGQTPKQRAIEMATAMTSLKDRGGAPPRTEPLRPRPKPTVATKTTPCAQQTKASADVPLAAVAASADRQAPKPPERTSEQDREDALAYLRARAAGKDATSLPAAAQLKRLDNMMPSKGNQTDERRAEDMAKMLAWLRKIGKAK